MSRQEVKTLRVITEEITNAAGGTPTIAGLTAGETEVLNGVTAGTVTASKAVVVDASKDVGDFRNVDVVNLDAGASGTAGSVDVFPATASKGKLTLAAVNNDGNTTTTISNAAMGQASVVSIPDPGAATANFLLTSQANDQSLVTATAAELNIMDGVTATAAEINAACDVSELFETVITTNVIAAAETGKTFFLNLADGFTSTLPAPALGLKFTFIVKTAPTTAYIINSNSVANIIHGVVTTGEDAAGSVSIAAAADTVNFVANKAIVGDRVDVVSDGTNWYLTGFCNVQDGITLVQAG